MEHQQQQHQDMAAGSPAEIKNDPGWVLASFPLRDNSVLFDGALLQIIILRNCRRHCHLNCRAKKRAEKKWQKISRKYEWTRKDSVKKKNWEILSQKHVKTESFKGIHRSMWCKFVYSSLFSIKFQTQWTNLWTKLSYESIKIQKIELHLNLCCFTIVLVSCHQQL